MNNWKQAPLNPAVLKYVECYWAIEKSSNDTGLDFPKLNPDPAGTLILAPANQTYGYQLDGARFEGSGSHLLLPNTKTITIDHTKPFSILGIKFHVGAMYSLKFDQDIPLVNAIIQNADCLLSELNLTHSSPPRETKSTELIGPVLDDQLLPWLQKSHEDQHSDLVRHIISIFHRTPLSEIDNALGCSQRTVERSFRRVTGMTLKQYESMVRIESLLSYLYQQKNSPLNWADIAIQFNFSDQPHLIRYLKSTIGTTPQNYLKQRDITIDVYGDFT